MYVKRTEINIVNIPTWHFFRLTKTKYNIHEAKISNTDSINLNSNSNYELDN